MGPQALILGSPSVPFDPELMQQLRDAPALALSPSGSPPRWALSAFIAFGALEREPPAATASPPLPCSCRLLTSALLWM